MRVCMEAALLMLWPLRPCEVIVAIVTPSPKAEGVLGADLLGS